MVLTLKTPTSNTEDPLAKTREIEELLKKGNVFVPTKLSGEKLLEQRRILAGLPGLEPTDYSKQLEESQNLGKLQLALSLAQRGFAAAGATPQRGESPISTLSRELLSPLAGDASTVSGQMMQQRRALKEAEKADKARLSQAALTMTQQRLGQEDAASAKRFAMARSLVQKDYTPTKGLQRTVDGKTSDFLGFITVDKLTNLPKYVSINNDGTSEEVPSKQLSEKPPTVAATKATGATREPRVILIPESYGKGKSRLVKRDVMQAVQLIPDTTTGPRTQYSPQLFWKGSDQRFVVMQNGKYLNPVSGTHYFPTDVANYKDPKTQRLYVRDDLTKAQVIKAKSILGKNIEMREGVNQHTLVHEVDPTRSLTMFDVKGRTVNITQAQADELLTVNKPDIEEPFPAKGKPFGTTIKELTVTEVDPATRKKTQKTIQAVLMQTAPGVFRWKETGEGGQFVDEKYQKKFWETGADEKLYQSMRPVYEDLYREEVNRRTDLTADQRENLNNQSLTQADLKRLASSPEKQESFLKDLVNLRVRKLNYVPPTDQKATQARYMEALKGLTPAQKEAFYGYLGQGFAPSEARKRALESPVALQESAVRPRGSWQYAPGQKPLVQNKGLPFEFHYTTARNLPTPTKLVGSMNHEQAMAYAERMVLRDPRQADLEDRPTGVSQLWKPVIDPRIFDPWTKSGSSIQLGGGVHGGFTKEVSRDDVLETQKRFPTIKQAFDDAYGGVRPLGDAEEKILLFSGLWKKLPGVAQELGERTLSGSEFREAFDKATTAYNSASEVYKPAAGLNVGKGNQAKNLQQAVTDETDAIRDNMIMRRFKDQGGAWFSDGTWLAEMRQTGFGELWESWTGQDGTYTMPSDRWADIAKPDNQLNEADRALKRKAFEYLRNNSQRAEAIDLTEFERAAEYLGALSRYKARAFSLITDSRPSDQDIRILLAAFVGERDSDTETFQKLHELHTRHVNNLNRWINKGVSLKAVFDPVFLVDLDHTSRELERSSVRDVDLKRLGRARESAIQFRKSAETLRQATESAAGRIIPGHRGGAISPMSGSTDSGSLNRIYNRVLSAARQAYPKLSDKEAVAEFIKQGDNLVRFQGAFGTRGGRTSPVVKEPDGTYTIR